MRLSSWRLWLRSQSWDKVWQRVWCGWSTPQHASFLETGKYVSLPSGVLRKLQELRLPNTACFPSILGSLWSLGFGGGWLAAMRVTDSSLGESKSRIGVAWESEQSLQLPGEGLVLKNSVGKRSVTFPKARGSSLEGSQSDSSGKNVTSAVVPQWIPLGLELSGECKENVSQRIYCWVRKLCSAGEGGGVGKGIPKSSRIEVQCLSEQDAHLPMAGASFPG